MLRRGIASAPALRACTRLCAYPASRSLCSCSTAVGPLANGSSRPDSSSPRIEARGQRLAGVATGSRRHLPVVAAGCWCGRPMSAAHLIALAFVRSRAQGRARAVALALAASAALPWSAYLNGHPLRVRYSLPLVFAARASCAASASDCCRARIRGIAAALLVAGVAAPRLAARSPGADGARSAARQRQPRRAPGGHRVSARALRSRAGRRHHDEHGVARPLHARSVGLRISTSATSCTKATAICGSSRWRAARRASRTGWLSRKGPKGAMRSISENASATPGSSKDTSGSRKGVGWRCIGNDRIHKVLRVRRVLRCWFCEFTRRSVDGSTGSL